MLRVVNDSKLGSHPVMFKPQAKHINLDFPAHNKRRFPIECPTQTPKFNSCKPPQNTQLTPNKDNSYSNNYNKSTRCIEPTTHELAINAMFRPAPYQMMLSFFSI